MKRIAVFLLSFIILSFCSLTVFADASDGLPDYIDGLDVETGQRFDSTNYGIAFAQVIVPDDIEYTKAYVQMVNVETRLIYGFNFLKVADWEKSISLPYGKYIVCEGGIVGDSTGRYSLCSTGFTLEAGRACSIELNIIDVEADCYMGTDAEIDTSEEESETENTGIFILPEENENEYTNEKETKSDKLSIIVVILGIMVFAGSWMWERHRNN